MSMSYKIEMPFERKSDPYERKLDMAFIEDIVQKHFGEYTIKHQNWGWNAPFLFIVKDSYVRVSIYIKHKVKKNLSTIYITGTFGFWAYFWMGYWASFVDRKDRKQLVQEVKDVFLKAIKEQFNVDGVVKERHWY